MKKIKITYWVSTGLLSFLMLGSAGMYIFNHAEITKTFTTLGFPTFIIYPLAIAKVTGIIVLWTSKNQFLKEWAYAGFLFNFLLAFGAHVSIGDGEFGGAVLAVVLLFTSYFTWKKQR